jgi:hypothetical protein
LYFSVDGTLKTASALDIGQFPPGKAAFCKPFCAFHRLIRGIQQPDTGITIEIQDVVVSG